MKKLLTAIATIVAVLTCAFSFTACGLNEGDNGNKNEQPENPDAGLYKFYSITDSGKTYNIGDELDGRIFSENSIRIYLDNDGTFTQISAGYYENEYYAGSGKYIKDGKNYELLVPNGIEAWEDKYLIMNATIENGVLTCKDRDIYYSNGEFIYGEEETIICKKDESESPYVGTYKLNSITYKDKNYNIGDSFEFEGSEITVDKNDYTLIVRYDYSYVLIGRNEFGMDGYPVSEYRGYDNDTFNSEEMYFENDILVYKSADSELKLNLKKSNDEQQKFQAGVYKFYSAVEDGEIYNLGDEYDNGRILTEDSLEIELFSSGKFFWHWREGGASGICAENIMYFYGTYLIEFDGDMLTITYGDMGKCTLKKAD